MTSSVFVFLFLVTLAVGSKVLAPLDFPACKFVPCDNNNQCGSFAGNCTKCNSTGFCDYGAACGGKCGVTSDCNQATPCRFCKDGACTSAGQCNAYCNKQSDCVNAADCGFCINNICVSQCGSPCSEDGNCNWSGSSCPYCENFKCQAGGCNSKCGSESDCAKYGGPCKLCTNYPSLGYAMCTSGCNMGCETDAQCAGFTSNCGMCDQKTKKCISGTCGTACSSNNGCENSPNSTCTKCTDGSCQKGLPCFSQCTVNTDCDQTSDCVVCSSRGYCLSTVMADIVDAMDEEEAKAFVATQKRNIAASKNA